MTVEQNRADHQYDAPSQGAWRQPEPNVANAKEREMPWIDDEMKAEVERRLRETGMSVTINRIHVDLGPEATRENVTDQLVASFIEAEQSRQRGEPSRPPVTGRKQMHIRDVVKELGLK